MDGGEKEADRGTNMLLKEETVEGSMMKFDSPEAREKLFSELSAEYGSGLGEVSRLADEAVFAARTPLLPYSLSKGEVWQLLQRFPKLVMSASSKIPLLVYLTDFVVTGVLGPAVVDIFNNDSGVESYLKHLGRLWTPVFRSISHIKDDHNKFSVEYMANLHSFMSSCFSLLRAKRPALATIFDGYDWRSCFSSYRLKYPPGSTTLVHTAKRTSFLETSSVWRDQEVFRSANLKLKLIRFEVGDLKLKTDRSLTIELDVVHETIVLRVILEREHSSVIRLHPADFLRGITSLGEDQDNLVFLYPRDQVDLNWCTTGRPLNLPTIKDLKGEDGRVVFSLNKRLKESTCEQLSSIFSSFLNGSIIEVDEDFACNLYTKEISHHGLFKSQQEEDDEEEFSYDHDSELVGEKEKMPLEEHKFGPLRTNIMYKTNPNPKKRKNVESSGSGTNWHEALDPFRGWDEDSYDSEDFDSDNSDNDERDAGFFFDPEDLLPESLPSPDNTSELLSDIDLDLLLSDLPEGWEQRESRSTGEAFFKNKYTKKSQWEKPTAPAQPVQTQVKCKCCREYFEDHKALYRHVLTCATRKDDYDGGRNRNAWINWAVRKREKLIRFLSSKERKRIKKNKKSKKKKNKDYERKETEEKRDGDEYLLSRANSSSNVNEKFNRNETLASSSMFRRRDSENVEEKEDSPDSDDLFGYLKLLGGSKDRGRKETPDKFTFKSSKQNGTPEPSASLSAEARDRRAFEDKLPGVEFNWGQKDDGGWSKSSSKIRDKSEESRYLHGVYLPGQHARSRSASGQKDGGSQRVQFTASPRQRIRFSETPEKSRSTGKADQRSYQPNQEGWSKSSSEQKEHHREKSQVPRSFSEQRVQRPEKTETSEQRKLVSESSWRIKLFDDIIGLPESSKTFTVQKEKPESSDSEKECGEKDEGWSKSTLGQKDHPRPRDKSEDSRSVHRLPNEKPGSSRSLSAQESGEKARGGSKSSNEQKGHSHNPENSRYVRKSDVSRPKPTSCIFDQSPEKSSRVVDKQKGLLARLDNLGSINPWEEILSKHGATQPRDQQRNYPRDKSENSRIQERCAQDDPRGQQKDVSRDSETGQVKKDPRHLPLVSLNQFKGFKEKERKAYFAFHDDKRVAGLNAKEKETYFTIYAYQAGLNDWSMQRKETSPGEDPWLLGEKMKKLNSGKTKETPNNTLLQKATEISRSPAATFKEKPSKQTKKMSNSEFYNETNIMIRSRLSESPPPDTLILLDRAKETAAISASIIHQYTDMESVAAKPKWIPPKKQKKRKTMESDWPSASSDSRRSGTVSFFKHIAPLTEDELSSYMVKCMCHPCVQYATNQYKLCDEKIKCKCEDCLYTKPGHYRDLIMKGIKNHSCHVCHNERNKTSNWKMAKERMLEELEDCWCNDCASFKTDRTLHQAKGTCDCHRCAYFYLAQKVGLGEAKPLVCESSIPKPKPPAPMPASTQVLSTSQPNSQGSMQLPAMSSKSVGALDPHTGANKANLGTSPSDILAADIDASLSPSMRGVTGFSGGWSATASPSQTSGQKVLSWKDIPEVPLLVADNRRDFIKINRDIVKSLDQGNHEAGLEYLHRKWDQSHKKMKEFGASVPLEAPGSGTQNMKDDRQKHPDASQSREKDLIKLPLQSKGQNGEVKENKENKGGEKRKADIALRDEFAGEPKKAKEYVAEDLGYGRIRIRTFNTPDVSPSKKPRLVLENINRNVLEFDSLAADEPFARGTTVTAEDTDRPAVWDTFASIVRAPTCVDGGLFPEGARAPVSVQFNNGLEQVPGMVEYGNNSGRGEEVPGGMGVGPRPGGVGGETRPGGGGLGPGGVSVEPGPVEEGVVPLPGGVGGEPGPGRAGGQPGPGGVGGEPGSGEVGGDPRPSGVGVGSGVLDGKPDPGGLVWEHEPVKGYLGVLDMTDPTNSRMVSVKPVIGTDPPITGAWQHLAEDEVKHFTVDVPSTVFASAPVALRSGGPDVSAKRSHPGGPESSTSRPGPESSTSRPGPEGPQMSALRPDSCPDVSTPSPAVPAKRKSKRTRAVPKRLID